MHCESKKTGQLMFYHNFRKCELIYKIPSPEDSRGSILCTVVNASISPLLPRYS